MARQALQLKSVSYFQMKQRSALEIYADRMDGTARGAIYGPTPGNKLGIPEKYHWWGSLQRQGCGRDFHEAVGNLGPTLGCPL